ncbi:MAG: hypothetical protein QXF68_04920 [Thermofilaceae archaeon]
MSLKRAALDAGVRTEVAPLARVEGGRAYRADVDSRATVIILDTDSGLRMACEPEIVGTRLEREALQAARAAAAIIAKTAGSREVAFLHVLRASMGYRLHEALKEGGFRLAEAYVRVRYPGYSTGCHEGRRAEVVYANLGGVSRERVLVVADTVATGESLARALAYFLPAVEAKGARVREVHVYGFLAEEGVRRVSAELEELGVERIFFYALQDLAALASNKYDMLLYGPDIPAYKSGKLVSLGGIVAEETLERMLPHYFPGMDQPGDWSERQCLLFNGGGFEEGRIGEHLERSLRALDELHEAVRAFPWYREELEGVYEKRRKGLLAAILSGEYCSQGRRL